METIAVGKKNIRVLWTRIVGNLLGMRTTMGRT
jgi:hypothetical protein